MHSSQLLVSNVVAVGYLANQGFDFTPSPRISSHSSHIKHCLQKQNVGTWVTEDKHVRLTHNNFRYRFLQSTVIANILIIYGMHIKNLSIVYYSAVIKTIKYRMRWAMHVTRIEEVKVRTMLVGKLRRRWQYNIEIDLK